eukprot:gb/GECH01010991.1/.p1 GENE.gb/GECH01010991.1/~~gb/GECH01010991.1/.p1  ORF type:complete len:828 (+),score=171.94 gb/GECH01010991.1/:1-2484(+)
MSGNPKRKQRTSPRVSSKHISSTYDRGSQQQQSKQRKNDNFGNKSNKDKNKNNSTKANIASDLHTYHKKKDEDSFEKYDKCEKFDQSMRSRLWYLVQSIIGQVVQVRARDGCVYEGVFSRQTLLENADSEAGTFSIVLRLVRVVYPPVEHQEVKDCLVLEATDLVSLYLANFSFGSAAPRTEKFSTDSEISKNQYQERELQPWVPDEATPDELLLEDDGQRDTSWDQFTVNRDLFGVQSTYHEEFYTTSLDRSSEFYAENEFRAERQAQEILHSQRNAANIHVRQERGKNPTEGDEETLYSAVAREGSAPEHHSKSTRPNIKYVPPFRRGGAEQKGTSRPMDSLSSDTNTGRRELDTNATLSSSVGASPTRTIQEPRHVIESYLNAQSGKESRSNSVSGDILFRGRDRGIGEEGRSRSSSLSTKNRGAAAAKERPLRIQIFQDNLRPLLRHITDTPSSPKSGGLPSPTPSGSPSRRRSDSSPLVAHEKELSALGLEPAKPKVPTDVAKQFQQFQADSQDSDLRKYTREKTMEKLRRFRDKILNPKPGLDEDFAKEIEKSAERRLREEKEMQEKKKREEELGRQRQQAQKANLKKDEPSSQKKTYRFNVNAMEFKLDAPSFTPPSSSAASTGNHVSSSSRTSTLTDDGAASESSSHWTTPPPLRSARPIAEVYTEAVKQETPGDDEGYDWSSVGGVITVDEGAGGAPGGGGDPASFQHMYSPPGMMVPPPVMQYPQSGYPPQHMMSPGGVPPYRGHHHHPSPHSPQHQHHPHPHPHPSPHQRPHIHHLHPHHHPQHAPPPPGYYQLSHRNQYQQPPPQPRAPPQQPPP